MVVLAGLADGLASGRRLLADRLAGGEALRTFREMVVAQGGDPGMVDHPERLPRAPIQRPVIADAAGTVLAIDAEAIGGAAMVLGAGRERAEDQIDPGAGLVIERKIGDVVRPGDALAAIHTSREGAVEEGRRRVRAAYTIGPGVPPRAPVVYEVVA